MYMDSRKNNLSNGKDYVAIDIKIGEDLYKFARVFKSSDGSIYITPEIKKIIESTVQSPIQDIHIADHASGQNHIRVKGMDIEKFRVKQITQISDKKASWYICINTSNKVPKDIFKLSLKKPSSYLSYYILEIKALPVPWLTMFFRVFRGSIKSEKRTQMKVLDSITIMAFGSRIRVTLCDGAVEKKASKYDLSLSPNGTKFPWDSKP
jgi:hypothetical protein